MEEQIILLRDFILETPASNSEHKKQEGRLQNIVGGYEEKIQQLKAENEKLVAQLKKKDG